MNLKKSFNYSQYALDFRFSLYDIRDAFLEFISSFMQNCKQYMNLNEKSLNMDFNSLFNFKDFLSDNK